MKRSSHPVFPLAGASLPLALLALSLALQPCSAPAQARPPAPAATTPAAATPAAATPAPAKPRTPAQMLASWLPAGSPLARIMAYTQAVDEATDESIAEVQRIVAQELAAERVTENAARRLTGKMSFIAMMKGLWLSPAITPDAIPAENAVLAQAAANFNRQWEGYASLRSKLSRMTKEAAAQRLEKLIATAKDSGDVTEYLTLLDSLDRLQPKSVDRPAEFAAYRPVATQLRTVLDLLTSRTPTPAAELGAALSAFERMGAGGDIVGCRPVITQRVHEIVAPVNAPLAEARTALLDLLQAGRPVAELTPALERLEAASLRARALQKDHWYTEPNDGPNNPVEIYRNCVRVAQAFEGNDLAAAQSLVATIRRYGLPGNDGAAYIAIHRLLAGWDKALAVDTDQDPGQWRGRLAAVRTPAELSALSAELLRELQATDNPSSAISGRVPPRGPGYEDLRRLRFSLEELAKTWAAGQRPERRYLGYEPNPVGSYTEDLAALRERIDRDLLVKGSGLTELGQPPYAALPLDTALERLLAQLAEKGEWRRLLEVAEARAPQPTTYVADTENAALVAAVRAYLVGQNLEQSESWSQALASYKTVLRSTSDLAPVQPAIERVKAITRAHPTIVVPAAPAIPAAPATPAAPGTFYR